MTDKLNKIKEYAISCENDYHQGLCASQEILSILDETSSQEPSRSLSEENVILKIKLADAEVLNVQLKKELDTVIELYQTLASEKQQDPLKQELHQLEKENVELMNEINSEKLLNTLLKEWLNQKESKQ